MSLQRQQAPNAGVRHSEQLTLLEHFILIICLVFTIALLVKDAADPHFTDEEKAFFPRWQLHAPAADAAGSG